MTITDLLKITVERGGSDLHISSGLPAKLRLDGELVNITDSPLAHDQIQQMALSIMTERQQQDYKKRYETDFAISIPELGRFRVNTFYQSRGASIVLRTIPKEIPTLEQLDTPKIFNEIAQLHQGLVLVTGPTGSGKSTTLAAIINQVNQTRSNHILTIEDPIEFMHTSQKSLISQREVSRHTGSFDDALRAALREDPDIILVGEMRDVETMRLAITAAETGHLVFGTLHTTTAYKTIDRIIGVFPGDEQNMICQMVAESLQAVVCQKLLKKQGGQGGRTAVQEILIAIPGIRTMIRDHKLHQIPSLMQTNTNIGMQTMDQALRKLVDRGLVSYDTAIQHVIHKESFGSRPGSVPTSSTQA